MTGGGPHYVIDPVTGEIKSKSYDQGGYHAKNRNHRSR